MTLHEIIEGISPNVKADPDIHAMWLEGSWATGHNNEHSDIDVWLDVKEGTFTHSINSFRKALLEIGEIDWEKSRGIYSSDPKLEKHTFHLTGFPDEQMIELDLQEHTRDFIFNKNEHIIEVIFDKDNTIRWSSD
jgi:predicted nucleotidyltransferase